MKKLLPAFLVVFAACHKPAPPQPPQALEPAEEKWDLLVRGDGEGLYKDLTVALDTGIELPKDVEDEIRRRAGVRVRTIPLSAHPDHAIVALQSDLTEAGLAWLRAHLARGGRAFVDECGDGIDEFARTLLGEPTDFTALGPVPPSHSSPDLTMRAVDGRLILSKKNLMLHGCGCSYLAKRNEYAAKLLEHLQTPLQLSQNAKLDDSIFAIRRTPTTPWTVAQADVFVLLKRNWPEPPTPACRVVDSAPPREMWVTWAREWSGCSDAEPRLRAMSDFRFRVENGKVRVSCRLQGNADFVAEILDLENRVHAKQKGRVDGGVVELAYDPADAPAPEELRFRVKFRSSDFAMKWTYPLEQLVGGSRLRVLGHERALRESKYAVRLLLQNSRTGEPIEGADVDATLAGSKVSGRTNEAGTVECEFDLPQGASEDAELVVASRSIHGHDLFKQKIRLEAAARILVVPDRPLYKPGDTVCFRALVLSHPARRPLAGGTATVEIRDSRGTPLYREELPISTYGVAHGSLPLSPEAGTGHYPILVTVPGGSARHTFEVSPYQLPKIFVRVETDRDTYAPGSTARLTIRAEYAWGAPVDGKVHVYGEDAWEAIMVQGRVELDVKAAPSLRVEVRDIAKQYAIVHHALAMSDAALRLYVLTDGPTLARGQRNRLYVLAITGDGVPVRTKVLVNGREFSTDRFGIALVDHDDSAIVKAEAAGVVCNAQFLVSDQPVIRVDRAFARSGETVTLEIFGAGSWTYLDFAMNGQLVGTRAVKTGPGWTKVEVPLPRAGTLTIQAHGTQASRLIYVAPADDLVIEARPDRESYKPGQDFEIDIAVRDAKGNPTKAALGVAIVDEALLALRKTDPGLGKYLFTLESILLSMTPRVQGGDAKSLAAAAGDEERRILGCALAAGVRTAVAFSIQADTWPGKEQARNQKVHAMAQTRMDQIYGAALRYLNGRKRSELIGMKTFENFLEALVKAGHLGRDQMRDPWGNVFVFRDGSMQVGFTSLGPDEAPGGMDVHLSWEGEELDRLRETIVEDVEDFQKMKGDSLEFLDPGIGGRWGSRIGGKKNLVSRGGGSGSTEERIRADFRETLLWIPELVTDDRGRARLTGTMADAITTWRMSIWASSARGQLGETEGRLRSIQPFFIDVSVAERLTVGDEVPVKVVAYNYTNEAREVEPILERDAWFDILESPKPVKVGAGSVEALAFRIRVREFGAKTVTVRTEGDSIRRGVRVFPAGREMSKTVGRALGTETIEIEIPEGIVGSRTLTLKIFPGPLSRMQDGLDALLRVPGG